MKLSELVLREQTENFKIEEEGDWKQRVFLTAYLRDEKKTWLDANGVKYVELTVDIDMKEKSAHVNHVIAHRKGQGYATEVLKYAEEKLKKLGIEKIDAYIEHSNYDSKRMFEKNGFAVEREDKHGDYWSKEL